jgi:hypothetical protein
MRSKVPIRRRICCSYSVGAFQLLDGRHTGGASTIGTSLADAFYLDCHFKGRVDGLKLAGSGSKKKAKTR